jgi:hypothetical protein
MQLLGVYALRLLARVYVKFLISSPSPQNSLVTDLNNMHMLTRSNELVDPLQTDVKWHGESKERYAVYRFNTKQKDQMFCPQCGASLGIDFREVLSPARYGISVRNLTLSSFHPFILSSILPSLLSFFLITSWLVIGSG